MYFPHMTPTPWNVLSPHDADTARCTFPTWHWLREMYFPPRDADIAICTLTTWCWHREMYFPYVMQTPWDVLSPRDSDTARCTFPMWRWHREMHFLVTPTPLANCLHEYETLDKHVFRTGTNIPVLHRVGQTFFSKESYILAFFCILYKRTVRSLRSLCSL